MLELILVAFAAAQETPPLVVIPQEPFRPGPTAAEFRTLSQPWRGNQPERMFPDLAIKDIRSDGDALYVLLANEGSVRARGPIKVSVRAETNGAGTDEAVARTDSLEGGESRWVKVRDAALASRATAAASQVSASAEQAAVVPRALDRTGQLHKQVGVGDVNEANNSLTLAASAIVQARP
jgi:hypothetical protein